MIFLEHNNFKVYLLSFLVVFTIGFVFFKWLGWQNWSIQSNNSEPSFFSQLQQESSSTTDNIKNEFEEGAKEIKENIQELENEITRQQLYDTAREYAEFKTSTSSNASTATSTIEQN